MPGNEGVRAGFHMYWHLKCPDGVGSPGTVSLYRPIADRRLKPESVSQYESASDSAGEKKGLGTDSGARYERTEMYIYDRQGRLATDRSCPEPACSLKERIGRATKLRRQA